MDNPFEQPTKVQEIIDTIPKPKLNIQIGQSAGFVIIEFSEPKQRLVITKKEARELIRRLAKETL